MKPMMQMPSIGHRRLRTTREKTVVPAMIQAIPSPKLAWPRGAVRMKSTTTAIQTKENISDFESGRRLHAFL
jgi:hypothetical protein